MKLGAEMMGNKPDDAFAVCRRRRVEVSLT
jgi:hypothetical protein